MDRVTESAWKALALRKRELVPKRRPCLGILFWDTFVLGAGRVGLTHPSAMQGVLFVDVLFDSLSDVFWC